MQQDAEELWTQLVYLLKEALKGGGASAGASSGAASAAAGGAAASTGAVDDAFAIGTHTKLVCAETGAFARAAALSCSPPPLLEQRAWRCPRARAVRCLTRSCSLPPPLQTRGPPDEKQARASRSLAPTTCSSATSRRT
jgi:hypothetical protein